MVVFFTNNNTTPTKFFVLFCVVGWVVAIIIQDIHPHRHMKLPQVPGKVRGENYQHKQGKGGLNNYRSSTVSLVQRCNSFCF